MANVLNKFTKEYRLSVNTPDYIGGDWLINPDLSAVAGIPTKYWKVVDDEVVEMSSEEKTVIDQLELPLLVKDTVSRAVAFGNNMIIDFATENVLLGITQLGLTMHVRKVTADVTNALITGSLYDAITEMKKFTEEDMDPIILTPARILAFRNKIEDHLGIPRAMAWDE